MSPQYVQYSNEKLSLDDDWKFHTFHQPIKNEQQEQLAPLKTTSI